MLHATEFLDLEGNVVVVTMNCGEDNKDFEMQIKGIEGTLQNTVPANSIQTYIISGA